MSDTRTTRYKIVAAPIGCGDVYRAWPDKTTYIRRFTSTAKQQDYWRRFVVPKSCDTPGLKFQLAMINEWRNGWEFVAEPRYADRPVICAQSDDQSGYIVECGRVAV